MISDIAFDGNQFHYLNILSSLHLIRTQICPKTDNNKNRWTSARRSAIMGRRADASTVWRRSLSTKRKWRSKIWGRRKLNALIHPIWNVLNAWEEPVGLWRLPKPSANILTMSIALTALMVRVMRILNIFSTGSKRIASIRNHAKNVYLHFREKPLELTETAAIICPIRKPSAMPVWLPQCRYRNRNTAMWVKLSSGQLRSIE